MKSLSVWLWLIVLCILFGGPCIFYMYGAGLFIGIVYNIYLYRKEAKERKRAAEQEGEQ